MTEQDRSYYEWGYRFADGIEVWVEDYGTDGSWIPAFTVRGMDAVDIYDGTEYLDIRSALDVAGNDDAAVLRRFVTVTVGDVEEVSDK